MKAADSLVVSKFLCGLRRYKGEVLAAVGTLTTPLVSLIGGIMVVRYLPPEETGLVNTAMLLPAYLSFLHFGVLTGMARELPLARGARDANRIAAILRATGRVSLYAGLIGGSVCLMVAAYSWFLHKPLVLVLAFVASALSVLAALLVLQIDTGLRGMDRFSRQGWAVVATNAVALATVVLIPVFGAVGVVLRICIAAVASLLVRRGTACRGDSGPVEMGELSALMRTGLPLLISATLAGFLMVADRTVVALMLSPRELGEFALASLIANSMQFVPQSLSMVLFPRIAHEYGAHHSCRRLRRFFWLTLGFNLATLVPLSIICYFAVGPLIHAWFPAYVPGIPAARVACLTCLMWVYLGVGSVIGVVNRMVPYLTALTLSLVLVWAGSTWAIMHGSGILGAAWARFTGTAVLCVFTIAYSYYLTSIELYPESNPDEQPGT